MFNTDNDSPRGFQMEPEDNKVKGPRQGTKRRLSAQTPEDKGEDVAGRKKSRNYLDTHKNIEKRRRDRINNCLNTLKTLVPECRAYSMSAYAAKKLDKAEILEMTIDYLHKVHQVHPGGLLNDPRMYFEAEQWVSELSHWVQQEKQCQNNVGDFVHSLLNHLQSYKTRSRFENILHNGIKAEPMTPPWNRPCSFNFAGIQQDDSSDDMLDDSDSVIHSDSPSGEQTTAEPRCTSNPAAFQVNKQQPASPDSEQSVPQQHFTPSVADFIKSLSQRNNSAPRPSSLPHQIPREFSKASPVPPLISPPDCNGGSCGTPNHSQHFRFPSPVPNHNQSHSCGCSCGANQMSSSCAQENGGQSTVGYPSPNTPNSGPTNSAQSAATTIQNLQHFITQQLNLPGASQALLNSWATITSNLVTQTLQQNPQQQQQQQNQQQRQPHHDHHHPQQQQQQQQFASQYQQQNHLHHYPTQQHYQASSYPNQQHESQQRPLHNHHHHNSQPAQQRLLQQQQHYRQQHNHHQHHHQHHQQEEQHQLQQQLRKRSLESPSALHFSMNEHQDYDNIQAPCNDTKSSSPENIDIAHGSTDTELQSLDKGDDTSTGGEDSGEGVDQGVLGNETHPSAMSSASFADLIKALETNAWPNNSVNGEDDGTSLFKLDGAPTLQDLPMCLPVHE